MISVGILTVSDRVSQGAAVDKSGPTLKDLVESKLGGTVVVQEVVPDDVGEIQARISRWADEKRADLILTTGGTGFGVRDVTPEAVAPILDKNAPGLSTAMLVASLSITPMAALSRPICGVRKNSIIVTLPGSTKGSVENLQALLPVLPHALELCRGEPGAGEQTHRRMQAASGHHDCGHHHEAKTKTHHQHHHHHHHHHQGRALDQQMLSLDTPVALRPRESPFPMIGFDEALSIVLQHAQRLPAEKRRVDVDLSGYYLAEDVHAKEPVPGYRASIVDGYAVIASDGVGEFPVVSGLLAGPGSGPELELTPGKIARVTTGAPVPKGATAVIMVEYTTVVSASDDGKIEHVVRINKAAHEGQDIREIGSDISMGERILRKGEQITPIGGEIGAMASVGVSEMSVFRKPIVSILSTGNELVQHDSMEPLRYGQIRDTNRPSLRMAIESCGYQVVDLGIAPDSPEELAAVVRTGLERSDVLVTTGGVSMGELDLLKPVLLNKIGARIHFGRVALRPGKPTTFATVTSQDAAPPKLIFSLPGNPVSALVTFYLFVLPSLKKLSGSTDPCLPKILVTLPERVRLDSRPEFQRAHVSASYDSTGMKLVAYTTGGQRSSRVMSMKSANALLILPAAADSAAFLEPGTNVEAYLLGPLDTAPSRSPGTHGLS
ncbi:MoaB/Mog domain-containing protein [Polychytrium aggregatum]|uniref:MoaB/Mog domain-containing protein n=1 Tax=Polychytrium aggregatum TaxID=110093 RepID=UPI0022FEE8E8|nr:MoaB/Mog domain-containing protein [Polychytrium aggregatum]KAI9199264.1 MoaB/Mog domain-containing protein [Polychytrium aggregatum]